MFIRFNLHPDPIGCAYVYAWPLGSEQLYCYRFRHTKFSPSLQFACKPQSGSDDSYVDFKSTVPFRKWLKKVRKSEFNDQKHYHLLKHNCANAANFALEAAGIKIHVLSYTFFPFYRHIVTPNNMYSSVKNHKLKMLNASNKEYCFQFSQFRLQYWSKQCFTEEAKLVKTITHEIERKHEKYPEHTEAQIDILMQTYQLLSHLPTDEECEAYLEASKQFRERALTESGRMRIILVHLLGFSAGILAGLTMNHILKLLSFEPEVRLTPKQTLALIIPSAITLFKTISKIKSINGQIGSTSVSTDLSRSMRHLVESRLSLRYK